MSLELETGGEQRPNAGLVKGGAWLVVAALLQKFATMLAFLVVTRMVAPDQIGLVAIAMAFLTIGSIFSEFGIAASLIQAKEISQPYVDTAFTLSLLLAVAMAAALAAAAPLVAGFYEDDRLLPLIWIAAASLFFRGIYAPLRGLMLRGSGFRELALLEFGAAVLGAIAATILVLRSHDVSSLLYAHAFEGFCLLVGGVLVGRPLPRRLGIGEGRRNILSFGSVLSFSRILNQTAGTFDVLLIGKIFPPAALGFFYTGQRITLLVPNLIVGKLEQLMFPHFSRHQDDKEALFNDYWTAVLSSALLVGWVAATIIVCAEPGIRLILGEQWLGAIPYIRIFSLATVIQGLGGGVIGAFIFGSGKVYLTVWLSVFRIVTFPACILIGSLFGPLGVAWAMVAFFAVGRVYSQLIVKWQCGLSAAPAGRILAQSLAPFVVGLLPFFLVEALMPMGAFSALVGGFLAVAIVYALAAGAVLLASGDEQARRIRHAISGLRRPRRLA